jgi:hypothetical protein
MNTNLEHAKELILTGVSYSKAAQAAGYSSAVALYADLKTDPDIVAAKESGALRSRKASVKSPVHYARKPHVRAVLEQGMTQAEAAAKFGVSQPLVSRHVRLATQEATSPKTYSTNNDPEIDALRALATAYAARHGLTYSEVLDKLQ